MQAVPQITPFSDMHHRQQEVLAMMDKAPVILAEESKPRAVLVSVEQWNRIVEEVKRSRQLAEAKRASAESDRNDSWIGAMELLKKLEQKHGKAMFESIRQELKNHVAG